MYLKDQKLEELVGNQICRNLRKSIKGTVEISYHYDKNSNCAYEIMITNQLGVLTYTHIVTTDGFLTGGISEQITNKVMYDYKRDILKTFFCYVKG